MLFDELRCYNSVTYKLRPLKCRGKCSEYRCSHFSQFSFKCSWDITAIIKNSRSEVFCKKGVPEADLGLVKLAVITNVLFNYHQHDIEIKQFIFVK